MTNFFVLGFYFINKSANMVGEPGQWFSVLSTLMDSEQSWYSLLAS